VGKHLKVSRGTDLLHSNLLKENGMKKKMEREKTAPVQNKDLAWVKGSSGYAVVAGDEGPGDQPPPGGG
jgi:hypothetical protein